jgi:hypothetical protein
MSPRRKRIKYRRWLSKQTPIRRYKELSKYVSTKNVLLERCRKELKNVFHSHSPMFVAPKGIRK